MCPTPRACGAWPKFYAFGIFKGEKHPYRKAHWRKHNPLQAMTHLALKLILFPIISASGTAYFLYFLWDNTGGSSELLCQGVIVPSPLSARHPWHWTRYPARMTERGVERFRQGLPASPTSSSARSATLAPVGPVISRSPRGSKKW